MASIRKHPKSKFWSARFYDSAGRQLTRSTKEQDKKKALKIAIAFEDAAQNTRTAKHTREVIEELHERITGESLASLSWRAFTESWIVRKTPEVSRATLSFYLNAIAKFTAFLGPRADLRMTELKTADVVGFRNQEAKTLAAKTVNHDLKCLKMVFRAALQDRTISEDPSEFVSIAKNSRAASSRRPFTIAELQAVLSVADEEWKSMILFGLYTGQRLGDIADLTWNNIDLPGSKLRLVTRKTGRTLVLPIANPLRDHLERLSLRGGDGSPIHPIAFATLKRQGKTGNLSNQFGDILALAGLREKKAHRKTGQGRGGSREAGGLSFHCLRHTAVSLMKEAGVPEAVVMELVGHDSEQMSAHYTHVGEDALQKAANALPNVL